MREKALQVKFLLLKRGNLHMELNPTRRCDQQLVFSQFIRTELSERSKAGISVHRKNLLVHPKPPKYIGWSTPEEEAAHMFVFLSHSFEGLLKKGMKNEFVVFGYYLGRAFSGSVDQLQATKTDDGRLVFTIFELKTSTDTHGLGPLSKQKAIAQGTLYQIFLRQMIDKEVLLDFQQYFHARGLHIDQPFRPEFSSALMKHMHPKLVDVTPDTPKSLRDLGERWKAYINRLPPTQFEEHVEVIVQRLARLSGVTGFGSTGKLEAYRMPCDFDGVFRETYNAVNVLDGHKEIVGIHPDHVHHCRTCSYSAVCRVRPDIYAPNERQPYLGRELPPIQSPQPIQPPQPVPRPQPVQLPQPAQPPTIPRYDLSRRLRSPPIKTSPVRDRTEIVKELTELRRKEEKILSQIEIVKRARRILAFKRRQQLAAERERQKIRAVYIAGMRKAQRKQAALQRKSDNPVEYAGLVLYEPPQVDTRSVVLYKPSLAGLRVKRMETSGTSRPIIPRGAQAIPEDGTYSLEKLQHIPGSRTYQFEMGPSLSEQQLALMQKEQELLSTSGHEPQENLTEVEIEEVERDARRARRREERARRLQSESVVNDDSP
ncbi:hypothetical protein FRC17_009417 [Serendipita sp. 399]|nr:hypothetical protein FRC17_009417 [Serendipita sp. 399]